MSHVMDPLENIIKHFKHHPSINAIKVRIMDHHLTLALSVLMKFQKKFASWNDKKSTTGINTRLLKENVDVCAKPMTDMFISCISSVNFPDELKLADISPIFRALDSTALKNYRPVSILNFISKSFEKLIQQQLSPFFEKKLNDHLCSCKTGQSTLYAFRELEKIPQ